MVWFDKTKDGSGFYSKNDECFNIICFILCDYAPIDQLLVNDIEILYEYKQF